MLAPPSKSKQQDEERVVAQAAHDAGDKALCFINQVLGRPLLDVPTQMPGENARTSPGISKDIEEDPSIWGFPQMGVPPNGWFLRENPIYKWMMAGDTPILGNLHIIPAANSLHVRLRSLNMSELGSESCGSKDQ